MSQSESLLSSAKRFLDVLLLRAPLYTLATSVSSQALPAALVKVLAGLSPRCHGLDRTSLKPRPQMSLQKPEVTSNRAETSNITVVKQSS